MNFRLARWYAACSTRGVASVTLRSSGTARVAPSGEFGDEPTDRLSTTEAGAAAQVRGDPLVGRTLQGRYRVLSRIAGGGMGTVYAAEQLPLGRTVALKVLSPALDVDSDQRFRERFFLEASACAKLRHPNVVTVFEFGEAEDDRLFIAMELLEGRTLASLLRDEGALGVERALGIASQIGHALEEAHHLGLVHRDLKPQNVFLQSHRGSSDFVKVLDFGLVKELRSTDATLTRSGAFMGSPPYASPEQIQGAELDVRSDIYSFGITLFEMLTGRLPFERPNSVLMLMAHLQDPVPSMRAQNPAIDVPERLEEVVHKCLAKLPEGRFGSMAAVLDAIGDAVPGLQRGPFERNTRPSSPRLLARAEIDETMIDVEVDEPLASSGVFAVRSSVPPTEAPPPSDTASARPPALARPSTRRAPLLIGAIALVMAVLIWVAVLSQGSGQVPPPTAAPPVAPVVRVAAPEPVPARVRAPAPVAAARTSVDAPAPLARTGTVEATPALPRARRSQRASGDLLIKTRR